MLRKALIAPGLWLAALLVVAGCSDGSDRPRNSVDPYLPIADPAVADPPSEGSFFLQLANFDLAEVGYRSREFFISGTATAFTNLEELAADGLWTAEPAETADFRTRIVVVRPENSADFSGTVLVEWLNVTSGFDLAPSWNAGRTGILRDGHAWIGVSAQIAGIEGRPGGIAPLHLKAINPARYASLAHPGDSFSYDIFSQVAQALRNPQDVDLLEGLVPERLIALGESQSAGRLTTYINAVHPLYNPYDGYLVHSRGNGSPPLAQEPQVTIETPEVVRIRTDLNAPVLTFQTETDIFYLGYVDDRQPDSEMFRLWEVAGTAHADRYTTLTGFDDRGDDPAFALVKEERSVAEGLLTCPLPMNNGPHPWVFNAALHALVAWVRDGTPPPNAERLTVNDTATAFVLDDLGNVLGGIRTPYVDVPAARLSGEGQAGGSFCFLFGTTELFDAATMASLHVDRNSYRKAVRESAAAAVSAGFLLQPDAARIGAAAGAQWDHAMQQDE